MTTPDDDPAKLPTLPPTSPATPAPTHEAPGHAAATDQPIVLGDDGYLRELLIGQGANGQVWRGRRRADDLPVAIKLLRTEYVADPVARVRFVRESTAMRAVDHPNVVPVHDLVMKGDTLAIVMELVAGETLRVAAVRNPFPVDRAVTVLAQIAGALAAVHAAGITHRDVKPENVLVTWRGGEPWTRLTDFGVAQVADGQALTRRSELVGTTAYVAPEVAMGRPAGPPADVYALGVVAYELLAGRRPFGGEHPIALLRAHIEDEPPRPPGLVEPLWRVVHECLAKRPEQRPTASELAERFTALRGRTGALPADAPPPLPPPLPTTSATSGAPASSGPAGQPDPVRSPAPATAADDFSSDESGPVVQVPSLPVLATTGATVPVPEAPPAPPPRRRRWLVPLLGLVTLALIAAGAGFWFGRPERATPGASPTSADTELQLFHLPVTATSPKRGTIRLDFGDASTMPGFDSYVIWRDSVTIDQLPAGSAPPYLLPNVDPRTRYCFEVTALVRSTAPPPPRPRPSCLTANGQSTSNTPK